MTRFFASKDGSWNFGASFSFCFSRYFSSECALLNGSAFCYCFCVWPLCLLLPTPRGRRGCIYFNKHLLSSVPGTVPGMGDCGHHRDGWHGLWNISGWEEVGCGGWAEGNIVWLLDSWGRETARTKQKIRRWSYMPEKIVSRRRSGSQYVNPLEKSNKSEDNKTDDCLGLKI